MTLRHCSLWTWVPVIKTPNKFNLGLLVLHAHDTSVGFEVTKKCLYGPQGGTTVIPPQYEGQRQGNISLLQEHHDCVAPRMWRTS
jgi:hypothetical protein